MGTVKNFLETLTEFQLIEELGIKTFDKGKIYQKQGRVSKCTVDYKENISGIIVTATVQGKQEDPYQVSVEVNRKEVVQGSSKKTLVFIDGVCTCKVEYNCKHVAATILEAIGQQVKKPASMLNITNLANIANMANARNANRDNIAVLLQHTLSKNTQHSSSQFDRWFYSLNENLTKKATARTKAKDDYQLLYILSKSKNLAGACVISLLIARPLKRGGFGNSSRSLSYSSELHLAALKPVDHDILHRLEVAERLENPYGRNVFEESYELRGSSTDQAILSDILATGRCYFENHKIGSPLQLGPAVKAKFVWKINPDGSQHLICTAEGKNLNILPLSPPWYLDTVHNLCGPLITTNLDPNLLQALLSAPPLAPQDITKMETLIKNKASHLPEFPRPHSFKISEAQKLKPKPKLLLFGVMTSHPYFYKIFRQSCELPLGRIYFIYDKVLVPISESIHINIVDSKDMTLNVISRNLSAETECVEFLIKQGAGIFSKRYPEIQLENLKPLDFLIAPIGNTTAQKAFLNQTIPVLQQAGWEVVVDQSFPIEYSVAIEDWYTEIRDYEGIGSDVAAPTADSNNYHDLDNDHNRDNDKNGINWFSMEIGIVVEGQKVNLLPLLVKLIEKNPEVFNEKNLKTLKSENFAIKLPNGRTVHIPATRINGILATLSELYDVKSLDAKGFLPLSRLRATVLLELEKAMEATRMRWLGTTKLKEFSEKLANFNGIESVSIPIQFKGHLRDYQKTGVEWLNFLRQYQLPGILSDDMGLGKTVQTLAHLLIEKEQGRMNKPCLIVAPTSLMENWRNEAARFVPSFKVLVLQGQDRRDSFNAIEKSDLVLTTYPLVVRDKEILLGHQYYMVILDEAHFVKNANTKAYLILQQIRSQYRLCLTGTPMENHLGELWSLFNFLSPGLLGDSKHFTQVYRTPIEKQGNALRRLSLNQRLKPYLLRRTKEEVVLELPPKTEIIHKLTLDDEQRDLYESIRLAMEAKVKKAIESKGVAGSQIIILDALLKLRQACCDPRLLKLEQAKKVKDSAKLNFLMEMLSELMEEKKKVLLFSSFTSMLTLIEAELTKRKMPYVKLTGSTVDRSKPIQSFQNEGVPIFLISLKAGGTGLNLTAADTVIHYDPWWNPAAETQATDRAHRIGQTKPVFVYKLITTGTVEEKILTMQEKKRALLAGLFDENQDIKAGKISAEDLKYLFKPIEEDA